MYVYIYIYIYIYIYETVVSSRNLTQTNLGANPLVISSGKNDPETGSFCPSTAGFPVSITVRVPASGKADRVWKPAYTALLFGALERKVPYFSIDNAHPKLFLHSF
jgi:hypothetical protein